MAWEVGAPDGAALRLYFSSLNLPKDLSNHKTDLQFVLYSVLETPPGAAPPAPGSDKIVLYRSEVKAKDAITNAMACTWAEFTLFTAPGTSVLRGDADVLELVLQDWRPDGFMVTLMGARFRVGQLRQKGKRFTLAPSLRFQAHLDKLYKKKPQPPHCEFSLDETLVVSVLDASPLPRWAPPGAIELHLMAQKLDRKNFGGLGKSDPYFTVRDALGHLLYKSEFVPGQLNPAWELATVNLAFAAGVADPASWYCAQFRVEVFDVGRGGVVTLIGATEPLSLADLVAPVGAFLLSNPEKKSSNSSYKNSGTLLVNSVRLLPRPVIEPVPPRAVRLAIRCERLDRKDISGSSDPFLVFLASGTRKLARTETVLKTLNPTFKPLLLSVGDIGDLWTPLKIQAWDWNRTGRHDYIGELITSLAELLYSRQKRYSLFNEEKIARGSLYTNSGEMIVELVEPCGVDALPVYAEEYDVDFEARNLWTGMTGGKAVAQLEIKDASSAVLGTVVSKERSLSPHLGTVRLNLARCSGLYGEMRFIVTDTLNGELIGEVSLTLSDLLQYAKLNEYALISSERERRRDIKNWSNPFTATATLTRNIVARQYRNSGFLCVINVVPVPSAAQLATNASYWRNQTENMKDHAVEARKMLLESARTRAEADIESDDGDTSSDLQYADGSYDAAGSSAEHVAQPCRELYVDQMTMEPEPVGLDDLISQMDILWGPSGGGGGGGGGSGGSRSGPLQRGLSTLSQAACGSSRSSLFQIDDMMVEPGAVPGAVRLNHASSQASLSSLLGSDSAQSRGGSSVGGGPAGLTSPRGCDDLRWGHPLPGPSAAASHSGHFSMGSHRTHDNFIDVQSSLSRASAASSEEGKEHENQWSIARK